ncbi:MAG: DNA replication complex subunit Gins51 [Candidatus Baldrarchaeia archaeon]
MDYEKLFSIWLKENEEEELQDLPPDFYREVSRYISELKAGLNYENLNSIELKVIELELENIQFIIKDLCSLRLEKILRNILKRKEQFESKLNPGEKKFFNPLMDALRNFYSFISRTLEGKALEIKETIRESKIKTLESERVAVRILENLPAIVGTDMKVYGPFKKGDIVVLPRKNSETLIRKKMAKIIDVRIIT